MLSINCIGIIVLIFIIDHLQSLYVVLMWTKRKYGEVIKINSFPLFYFHLTFYVSILYKFNNEYRIDRDNKDDDDDQITSFTYLVFQIR